MGFPLMNCTEVVQNTVLRYKKNDLQELSQSEQTAVSGVWNSRWFNTFPDVLRFLINERTLRPFHWIQKLFRKSPRCVMLIAVGKFD
jgi:hypothetical protein